MTCFKILKLIGLEMTCKGGFKWFRIVLGEFFFNSLVFSKTFFPVGRKIFQNNFFETKRFRWHNLLTMPEISNFPTWLRAPSERDLMSKELNFPSIPENVWNSLKTQPNLNSELCFAAAWVIHEKFSAIKSFSTKLLMIKSLARRTEHKKIKKWSEAKCLSPPAWFTSRATAAIVEN